MKASKQIGREAKRLLRLCLANGLLDEARARRVAQYLGEAETRRGLATLREFKRLIRLECARHAATVQSAAPLPVDLQADVQARLAKVYGPGLSTSFQHIPSLIGGMRIKVASDVYDGSVQAGLAMFEASL